MVKRCLVAAALFASIALAAETPLSAPPPGPTPAGVKSISLVPVGDGFVGVWTEGSECTDSFQLRGIRFDRQLRPFQDRSFLIAPLLSGAYIVGTAPDGYAAYVAWRSGTVHVARIDADATVTVLNDSVPVASYVATLSVSRDYLVFVQLIGTVTLLDHSGAVVRNSVPLFDSAATASSVDTAVIGGTLLVTFIGVDKSVHASSVLLADVAANRVPPAPVQSQPGEANSVRLATDGTHTMAFWTETATHLRARPLNAAGNPLSAGPLTLGSFSLQDLNAIAASDGYRVFFVENHQLVSLRVGFDGTLQSTTRSAPLTFGSYGMTFAPNGDATIAMRMEQQQAVIGAILADGNFAPGTILSIGVPEQHVRKLLPFGGGVAALWTESAPNARLVVGRLSAGKPLDGAGLRLRESQLDQSGSAVATDGERLAVVWTEGGGSLYAAIVAFPNVSVRKLAGDVALYSDLGISWNGTSFVISYRRASDFAALRVDRLGNPIDPAPVSLMAAASTEIHPRLAFNGSDYLLLWERWYDPFIYIGEQPCPLRTGPLPNELFAQRFSAALTPLGAATPLATTTNYNDYLLDVQGDDVSFGGVWMISWADRSTQSVDFARIDANGQRLDPLNGRSLLPACSVPFMVPVGGGWTITAQLGCSSPGLWSARVAADGTSSAPSYTPIVALFPGPATIEALTLAPQPIIAYKRSGSPLAYVDVLPQHPRAARH
ncbi:MAG TPA: hypothetical protein VG323_13060 [Thermoanaerobaculia bacterium]|nr:hypothetical protein [Thermoanaerobaculia bacterium]